MAKVEQFAIAVENRSGAVAEIAKAFRDARVNDLSPVGTSQGTSGTIQTRRRGCRASKDDVG